MSFFPEIPDVPEPEPDEPDSPEQDWWGPPEGLVAGVVPVELVLGRSESTAVALIGMRAFPTGLGMSLSVRARGRLRGRDLNAEVFDGPYRHETTAQWQRGRLKWGFEFSDGRRATNVDPAAWSMAPDPPVPVAPDRPVLTGGGGGGGSHSVERYYWLWPLPPAGRIRIVCQWLEYGIELTEQELDAEPFLAAALRAQPMWPEPIDSRRSAARGLVGSAGRAERSTMDELRVDRREQSDAEDRNAEP